MASGREEELSRTFGARLRALRRGRGLSLEELEARTGLSRSSLTKYERGLGNPTLTTLALLADALGVAVSALLREEPDWPVPLLFDAVEQALAPMETGLAQKALEYTLWLEAISQSLRAKNKS